MKPNSSIKEYLELSKRVEELEREVMKEIVTYLLVNSDRPDKRTLRAMERELGIPYSKLRRLAGKLIEEGVVVEGSVGTAKPLSVLDLDLALRKGYLKIELSLKSMIRLHNLASPSPVAILGEVKGDEVYRMLPKTPLRLEEKRRVSKILEWMRILPDLPSQEEIIERFKDKWPKEELEYRKKLLEDVKRKLSDKEWRELVELNRELGKWGPFVPMSGGIPELYMPFMRSNTFEQPQDLDRLVVDYMRITGLPRDSIKPLRYTPHLDPWALYYRDVVFELQFKELSEVDDEELRRVIKRVAEKNLKFLIYLVKPLIKDIEKIGVKGVLKKWNRGIPEELKYTEYHILSEVVPLGFASLLVRKLGNKELAEEALKYVKMLVAALIYDYKGEEKESKTLEELAEEVKL